jgi:hypothetical protein
MAKSLERLGDMNSLYEHKNLIGTVVNRNYVPTPGTVTGKLGSILTPGKVVIPSEDHNPNTAPGSNGVILPGTLVMVQPKILSNNRRGARRPPARKLGYK